MMMSVTEYAKLVGVDPSAIRRRILRGVFPATKVGKQWIVDSETEWHDGRFKVESPVSESENEPQSESL